jgi:hypothetical protein
MSQGRAVPFSMPKGKRVICAAQFALTPGLQTRQAGGLYTGTCYGGRGMRGLGARERKQAPRARRPSQACAPPPPTPSKHSPPPHCSRGVQPGGIYVCVGAARAGSRRPGAGLAIPAAALVPYRRIYVGQWPREFSTPHIFFGSNASYLKDGVCHALGTVVGPRLREFVRAGPNMSLRMVDEAPNRCALCPTAS